MPRGKLTDLVSSTYTRSTPDSEWGRPRLEAKIMIKMHFLSLWYNLSDELVEEHIYDRASFQQFLDIDITTENIPDATTLCRFRKHLNEHKLPEKMLNICNDILKEKGIMIEWGMLIDATIIAAPSSTKNKARERDPDMSSTKKTNNYHFWAKVHIWTDKWWLIEKVHVTTAKTHDSQVYEEVVSENTKETTADSAYIWKPLLKKAKKQDINHRAMKKRIWKKNLSSGDRLRNTLLSVERKIVEFPFWVIKDVRWHRKTRYRWLAKLSWMWHTLSMLCNMYRVRYKLM